MPKVRGPLFSLSASGQFDDKVQFRTTAAGCIVTRPQLTTPPRSPAQDAQAARFQVAVQGWRDLDMPTRDQWRTAATSTGMTGYQFYISEYMGQNITPPDQPMIP